MKLRHYLISLLLLLTFVSKVSFGMWEAGELTYPTGETEVSAFVNSDGNTQLQAVLCSKNSTTDYRFTLLLPHELPRDEVIQINIATDDIKTVAYGEAQGNSLDIQIDENLLLALPDTPKMTFSFSKEDAEFLNVPQIIDVNMSGSDMTLKNVASQCTVLCISNNFRCNAPLLSTLLWPRDKFKKVSIDDIDELCTKKEEYEGGHYVKYKFNNSKACKLALDRFYKKDGIGPLSFLNTIFNDKNSAYQKYKTAWNNAVQLAPFSAIKSNVLVDDEDWYLTLYSLAGRRHLVEFPSSFYNIKNTKDDPTTLVYDIDSRYEIEQLKYSSVLYRRVKTSVQAVSAFEKAHKMWSDFYRTLTTSIPNNIKQAQAIRPIIYRSMLLRIWRLAGRPEGIHLDPINAFRQGTNGKTSTKEKLESQCSLFEGANGEQFFFASNECINGIHLYMQTSPLNNNLYQEVLKKWDKFAIAWKNSPFSSDNVEDAVGENTRAKLALVVLSLFKNYGFGDYFQLRECISSRDPDICSYEYHKLYNTYSNEFNYRLDSISNVSEEDGNTLNEINNLWQDYFQALRSYIKDLEAKDIIPKWKGFFVLGTASVIQTNALLNFPYDREELPDISLRSDDDEDDFSNMSIEQSGYEDDIDEKEDDPDVDISDDYIVPEN